MRVRIVEQSGSRSIAHTTTAERVAVGYTTAREFHEPYLARNHWTPSPRTVAGDERVSCNLGERPYPGPR